ncbi:MAG: zinc ribbon domain-containing protein [Christensenellaceae bacterium]|jgi:hypothetical protein
MGELALVAMVLGLIGGIVIGVFFLQPKKRGQYLNKKGLLYVHDFLNLRTMIVGWILKYGYVILACILTLLGFVSMFQSFLAGFMTMTIGNVALRVVYEYMMIFLSMHENLVTLTDHFVPESKGPAAPTPASPYAAPAPRHMPPQPQHTPSGQAYDMQQEHNAAARQANAHMHQTAETNAYAQNAAHTEQPAAPKAPAQPAAPAASEQPASKFCPVCGKPNAQDAAFCIYCGYKF